MHQTYPRQVLCNMHEMKVHNCSWFHMLSQAFPFRSARYNCEDYKLQRLQKKLLKIAIV
jgi:hypothetical protein